jgi:hypothetical protein
MASITVNPVPYATNPELWDDLLRNDPLQYPLGFPMDQEYLRAYAPHISYQDLSMIAQVDDQVVAGLQITSQSASDGSGHIDFYGRPALLRVNRGADEKTRGDAEALLAERFHTVRESLNLPTINYLEMCPQGALSEFAISLLNSSCSGTPVYKQIIDLQRDEDNLRTDIRKRYRNFINWGEKNLTITVHDFQNTSPDIIEEFRQLHIAVAGKETRSSETWHIQYRQIADNLAFLVTGRLDGQLVTAALFLHSPLYCYYGVGASIREMFDKPLSHAIMWRSILEAKRRGCRLYEMGDMVDLYPDGYSEKEKNIANFKRGFGGEAFLQLKIGKKDRSKPLPVMPGAG